MTKEQFDEEKKKMGPVFFRQGDRVPLHDMQDRFELHLSQMRSGTTVEMAKNGQAPLTYEVELEAADRMKCRPLDMIDCYLSLLRAILGSSVDARAMPAKLRGTSSSNPTPLASRGSK